MKLKKVLKRKGYIVIKLKKIKTNHYEVKVKINGKKGRFILDTGASNSCVDFKQEKHFKLIAINSTTKAAGAGAINMPTQQAKHNHIKIRKWTFNNFNLVLFDLSHVNTALSQHNAKPVNGIIGADILEKGKAIIDYRKNRLYLKQLIYKF